MKPDLTGARTDVTLFLLGASPNVFRAPWSKIGGMALKSVTTIHLPQPEKVSNSPMGKQLVDLPSAAQRT